MEAAAFTEESNQILKKMWRIDKKLKEFGIITEEETTFYNQNLIVIKHHYWQNAAYWVNKTNLI